MNLPPLLQNAVADSQRRTEAARAVYLEILQRAAKPEKSDAAALLECMTTLGVDVAGLQSDYGLVTMHAGFLRTAADESEIAEKLTQVKGHHENYAAESESIKAARREKAAELRSHIGDLVDSDEISKARTEWKRHAKETDRLAAEREAEAAQMDAEVSALKADLSRCKRAADSAHKLVGGNTKLFGVPAAGPRKQPAVSTNGWRRGMGIRRIFGGTTVQVEPFDPEIENLQRVLLPRL